LEIADLKKDASERMNLAIESTRLEFSKVRTGKASAALLDTIRVSYYGNIVPLKQVGTVNVPEPRLITVQPWEKNIIGEIEKAILQADLGLNPSNDGNTIRIPIPQLTEDRRKDLVRLCHKFAEEGRIGIRNIRRDSNDQLKKAEKLHDISEDQCHTALDEIQKITNDFIKHVDELLAKKEKEVLEV